MSSICLLLQPLISLLFANPSLTTSLIVSSYQQVTSPSLFLFPFILPSGLLLDTFLMQPLHLMWVILLAERTRTGIGPHVPAVACPPAGIGFQHPPPSSFASDFTCNLPFGTMRTPTLYNPSNRYVVQILCQYSRILLNSI